VVIWEREFVANVFESRIQGDGVPLDTFEKSLSQAADRLSGVRQHKLF